MHHRSNSFESDSVTSRADKPCAATTGQVLLGCTSPPGAFRGSTSCALRELISAIHFCQKARRRMRRTQAMRHTGAYCSPLSVCATDLEELAKGYLDGLSRPQFARTAGAKPKAAALFPGSMLRQNRSSTVAMGVSVADEASGHAMVLKCPWAQGRCRTRVPLWHPTAVL